MADSEAAAASVRWAEIGPVIHRLSSAVRRRAAHYAGPDRDAVDDLVQETWIRVARGHHAFRNDSSESTWVLRICDRVCIDFIRSKSRDAEKRHQAEAEHVVSDVTHEFSGHDEPRVDPDCVANAVVALPPRHRTVAIAFYWFSYKPREIARMFGLRPSTVWKLLSETRGLLRRSLRSIEVTFRAASDLPPRDRNRR